LALWYVKEREDKDNDDIEVDGSDRIFSIGLELDMIADDLGQPEDEETDKDEGDEGRMMRKKQRW
jgi:hypothetical protein